MRILDLAQLGEAVGAAALLPTTGDVGVGQLLDHFEPLLGRPVLQHGLHDAGGIVLHGHLGELAAEQFHQLVGHFSRLLLGVGLETELVPDLLRGHNGVGMAAVRLTLVLQRTLLVGGRLIAAAAAAAATGSRCIELALAARAFVTIGAKLFLRRCVGWHLSF